MMWEPDGWGSRARIGLLTPHNDIVPEDVWGPSGWADDVFVCSLVLDRQVSGSLPTVRLK